MTYPDQEMTLTSVSLAAVTLILWPLESSRVSHTLRVPSPLQEAKTVASVGLHVMSSTAAVWPLKGPTT